MENCAYTEQPMKHLIRRRLTEFPYDDKPVVEGLAQISPTGGLRNMHKTRLT